MDNLLRSIQIIKKVGYTTLLIILLLEIQRITIIDLTGDHMRTIDSLDLTYLLHQPSDSDI